MNLNAATWPRFRRNVAAGLRFRGNVVALPPQRGTAMAAQANGLGFGAH
jgi:hypothetical protein